jgi:hypothetical protein
MGLPILQAALKKQLENTANASLTGWLAISSLLCLEEFLLLLFTAGILEEFKVALEGLIAAAAAQVAILEVVVAELESINTVISTFINTVKSLIAAAAAKLSIFPFNNPLFQQCPIVQAIEQDITVLVQSSLSPFAKVYKGTLADINLLQYQLLRNQKSLLQINQKIAALQQSILAWQAIINAIANQFGIH